jgi:alpha-beta hydrolase superfamily lysophospholipase
MPAFNLTIYALVLLALGLLIPASLMARGKQAGPDAAMGKLIEQVRRDLQPLDRTAAQLPDEATRSYFDFYGLNPVDTSHAFGSIPSGEEQLAVHLFWREGTPRGTVLLVHGYFDHAGHWRHVIADLLGAGFAIATVDLPGHGLSTGKRADIDDFSAYSQALLDVLPVARQLGAPLHVVAHSMGCSAVIDALLNRREVLGERIVLISPLLRSYAWMASGLGEALIGGLVAEVPRVLRKSSSDEQFFEFMQRDPLQYRGVPLGWVEAQGKWAKRTEAARPSAQPLLIIQGTADTTVSWRHNLRVLRRKFPKAEIIKVKRGGHQLHNEAPALRATVLAHLRAGLE